MSPSGREAGVPPLGRPLNHGLARVLVVVATLAPSASCTRDVSLLRPPDPVDAAPEEARQPPDASMLHPSCQGVGAPVRFATPYGATCAATLAARAHRTAICSCSDWNVPGSVQIIDNPSMPGNNPAPAAIGVNGNLVSTADITVPGAVYVSGSKGVTVTGRFNIMASLRSGGPITFTGPGQANVDTDVYAAGDVIGPAKIGGTLHLPAGALMGAATVAATTSREVVSVPPPCDCTLPFDVSAAISAVSTTNDNAALGLSIDRLANITTATTLDLPCGVYALSNISAQAPLTLAIHGRVLLAVAGDVLLQRAFFVTADPAVPEAEIDLLLQGSFTANGSMVPVGASNAEMLRIWMKGSGPISLPNWPVLGAIVQAPQAALLAPRGMSAIGSVTTASLAIGGPLGLTYDDAVLSAGNECGDATVDPLP